MHPAIIKSPKATQIKTLFVATGAMVQKGDPLIELHDFEELKLVAQVDRGILETQAKLLEASGPRIADKVGKLHTIANSKLETLKHSQNLYQLRQDLYAGGRSTILDVIKARVDVGLKTYQCLQSAVEVEIYQANLTDSLGALQTIELLLTSEKDYVQASIARLTIKAPRTGVFTTSVSKGTPVRLGHVLGQIE